MFKTFWKLIDGPLNARGSRNFGDEYEDELSSDEIETYIARFSFEGTIKHWLGFLALHQIYLRKTSKNEF